MSLIWVKKAFLERVPHFFESASDFYRFLILLKSTELDKFKSAKRSFSSKALKICFLTRSFTSPFSSEILEDYLLVI